MRRRRGQAQGEMKRHQIFLSWAATRGKGDKLGRVASGKMAGTRKVVCETRFQLIGVVQCGPCGSFLKPGTAKGYAVYCGLDGLPGTPG